MAITALLEDFFQGRTLACARLISRIENDPGSIPEILDAVLPRRKGAIRIGVTGPPGVGKSTVTAGLAKRAVAAGHSVGILAVDPSSPFSGGAFLGDRVRMHNLGDSGVFIRSLASREGTGGLSPAAPYAAEILDAFGMDRIFIETVGVGQAELDVMTCADLILLVLQPGAGDVIQTLKSGILEIADLFLVNKIDLPGADALLESLRFLFEISGGRRKKTAPPVLSLSADRNVGLDEAHAAMEDAVGDYVQSGRYDEKRRERLEAEIRKALREDLWEKFSIGTNGKIDIRAAAETLLKERRPPYRFVRDVCSRILIEFKNARPTGENEE
jgi:LAO/AO transport system kinase